MQQLSPQKSRPRAIIFGAGMAGQAALENLKAEYNVIGFCDNCDDKIGKNLSSLPIYSVAQLQQQSLDKVLIASEYFEQIERQLHALNLSAKIEVLPARHIKSVHIGANDTIRTQAVRILHLVTDAFDKAGINYYVDAGTLLGIVRDDALIPWDDDLDLALDARHLQLALDTLATLIPRISTLTGADWKVTSYINQTAFGAVKVGAVRSLKLKALGANNELPMMDLFVKYLDGEHMDYCLASRGIRMPSEHFVDLERREFAGQAINLPAKVELYLERHYGDWRTPKQDWKLSELQNSTVFQGD